jgi:lambda repressor-like predicted transcriptional regulator
MPLKKKSARTQMGSSREVQRLLTLLRAAIKSTGPSYQALVRQLGLSPNYLSRLFSGTIDLKVEQVVTISRAIGLEPAEIFQLAFPKPRRAMTPAGERFKTALEEYVRTGVAPWGKKINLVGVELEEAPSPSSRRQDTNSSDLEVALEKLMAKTLLKVLESTR